MSHHRLDEEGATTLALPFRGRSGEATLYLDRFETPDGRAASGTAVPAARRTIIDQADVIVDGPPGLLEFLRRLIA